MGKYRLHKLAKDCNVAVPTIVEFLHSKGIEVNNNPNATVDSNAISIVCAHFTPKNPENIMLEPHNIKVQMPNATTDESVDSSAKSSILNDYDKLLKKHSDAIARIRNLQCKHSTLEIIQKKNIDKLVELLEKIALDFDIVKNDIVWDHLVVGFFGETNAGKSTLIETLRLKFSLGDALWKHGAIVGNGTRDFTKDSAQYELDINGKRVTLIDIPGIEGEESKYAAIIQKALRKAHFVLYVHPNETLADEKIALSIKRYLADWTRVYSIWNIHNNPAYYRDQNARLNLLSESLVTQESVIRKSFENLLGKDLYMGNIVVQALLGLASCSDFPDDERMANKAAKLKSFFSSDKELYDFSCVDNLVKIFEHSANIFENIIIDSQKQKLNALKINSRRLLNDLSLQQEKGLDALKNRLEELCHDVKNQTSQLNSKIRNRSESLIAREFSKLRAKCESAIDSRKSTEEIVRKITGNINSLPYLINAQVEEVVSGFYEEFIVWLKGRFDEFKDINFNIPDQDIQFNVSIDVDVKSVTDSLRVSLDDVIDVGSSAVTGATLGGGIGSFVPVLGTAIGTAIGAAAGAAIGGVRKYCYGDRGRGEAKKNLKDELDVCKAETLHSLNYQLKAFKSKIKSSLDEILRTIQHEINNIEDLKKEIEDLYYSL